MRSAFVVALVVAVLAIIGSSSSSRSGGVLVTHAITVVSTFDFSAKFGELTMDAATYIAHVDVTVNIPFDGFKAIPYLQVGPIGNVPTPVYTGAGVAVGGTKQDAIPCVASTVPMTTATDYSCATLSRADLFPFNCSLPARPTPGPFTLATLRSLVAPVADQPYFNGPTPLLGEVPMNSTASGGVGFMRNGVRNYIYDVNSTRGVGGSLFPLYCGECLLNATACTAAQRSDARCSTGYTVLAKAPAGGGRIHVAKIVPYLTFPSLTQMTYHFQYAVPQLASDCAQNGVTTAPLYDATGTLLIGTQTTFSLVFGFVYQSFNVPTDQRQYQVDVYSGSSQSSNVMFSVLYVLPSQYTVSLVMCENPTPVYYNSTWAALPYCYVLTELNVGNTAVTVGPRILLNADGSQYGDVSSVLIPNKQLGSRLLSITPGLDPVTQTSRVFCPATSASCTFIFRFITAPQRLNANGATFQPAVDRAAGAFGPFDMAFPPYSCLRALPSNCTLVIPGSATNATLYDTFLVTLVKDVFPDINATYVFASRMDLYMQDDISYANLLDAACASTLAAQQPSVAALCASTAHAPASQTRGSRIVVYISVANPLYWNSTAATEEIDPVSLVFTVTGRRPQGNTLLVPLVITVDATTDAAKWAAFQQTWVYAPRRWVTDGYAAALGTPMSPTVKAVSGTDAIHIDYSKFFFFLVAQYGVQYTDILDTLTVSANVRYRSATAPGTSAMARMARVSRMTHAMHLPATTPDNSASSSSSSSSSSASSSKTTTTTTDEASASSDAGASTTPTTAAAVVEIPDGTLVSSSQTQTITMSRFELVIVSNLTATTGNSGTTTIVYVCENNNNDGGSESVSSGEWGTLIALLTVFILVGIFIAVTIERTLRHAPPSADDQYETRGFIHPYETR